jgi:UDP-N-acetylmuramyl pentapeptide phosphotransferase/UDP-N-acetylglucosamine-1-phosphate transferase
MGMYVAGFLAAASVAVLLVVTKKWHGRYSMDGLAGVQKHHIHPTPRVGGLAVMSGLLVVWYLATEPVRGVLFPMLIAGLPAFFAGLLEDVTKRVGVLPRLIATMLSGVAAWYITGIAMQNTGVFMLDQLLLFTPVAVLFTAFAVGGVANAVNIIDGFNGLASGSIAIMLVAMGLIGLQVGDASIASVCFAIASVSIGFGAVNWPLGKLFLGDGGAYLLGFLLAWIAVLLPMRNTELTAWTTMLVCAYPVLEVLFSVQRRRKREGHHPGQPDKAHLHHFVHRRMVNKLFPGCGAELRNGLTSPFCWLYAALPAAWAVVFSKSPSFLALGMLVAVVTYAVIYARLTQFRWRVPFR